MTEKIGSCFTISLDFELHWGVLPSYTVAQYKKNLEGTPESISRSLGLFRQYGIHATWATVGFLFYKNVAALKAHLPSMLPAYDDAKMNSYLFLNNLQDEYSGSFHFAPDLVEKISNTPHQEIGTHTFSHYFCLEEGQEPEQFKADLKAAISAARSYGIELKSIVFPRNQFNENYLGICKDLGVLNVRGCQNHYIYRPRDRKMDKRVDIRVRRLLDSYINITGHHSAEMSSIGGIVDIPASRQYKPYSRRFQKIEKYKINRIKKEMTSAAQKQKTYHLWWHPHNLGNCVDENIDQLHIIFQHYESLKASYGMRSLNMGELGNLARSQLVETQNNG